LKETLDWLKATIPLGVTDFEESYPDDTISNNVKSVVWSVASCTVEVGAVATFVITAKRGLWQAVVRELGNSLLTTVSLGIIWQLFGSRAFLNEVLAKVGISKELTFAGIKQVTDSFHNEIDWAAMFRNTASLDIFFGN